VRCSRRVVGAASKFQPKGISAAHCHHESDGPPLKSFLYDDVEGDAAAAARYERCAAQTIRALEHVTSTFSELDLNNRVAIIVPDADFRHQLAQPLARQLSTVYPDRFEMLDAAQASRLCIRTGGNASSRWSGGREKIIMDEVSQLDGTEFLIVICVGLDTQMAASGEASERDSESAAAFAESRSRLYRGVTRAHMLALAVNSFVPGGWLEYLTTVRLKADTRFDPKAARMSKEQQERLDDERKRQQEQHAEAEAFIKQAKETEGGALLSAEETAFIKQKILAALRAARRPAQDLDAVFKEARSVCWPQQQQLDRIPQVRKRLFVTVLH
jgi:hypothetical protein